MSDVKPCPFCGGKDIRFDQHRNQNDWDTVHPPSCDAFKWIWSMGCYECGATFANRYNKEILVERWNRRVEND